MSAEFNHPCFQLLFQVMNMYGELIMESVGHKVSLLIYLFFVNPFKVISHICKAFISALFFALFMHSE